MSLDLDAIKKKMNEWIDSPAADAYFEKERIKNSIHEKREKKFAKWLENNSFDDLMSRLQKSNGKEWQDKCYKKGYEPYPTALLGFVIGYAESHGVEHDFYQSGSIIDGQDLMFLGSEIIYENYIFQTFHGQGSFTRISKAKGGTGSELGILDREYEFFLQT